MSIADKHIIVASYFFPPLGLAGTARPLAMANFFAEQGCAVSVLTVKDIAYSVHDYTQLALLHPNVKIHRAGSNDPARLAKRLPLAKLVSGVRKVLPHRGSGMIFPDSKVGFVKPATKLLRKLFKPGMQNLLITTSPPVSIHKLGLAIAELENVKWVADFRDVWGSLPPERQGEEYRAKANQYLTEVLNGADLITATSENTVDHFRSEIAANSRYHFLPNGFNESDFVSDVGEASKSIGLYGTQNELVGLERILEWVQEFASSRPELDFRIRHVGLMDVKDINALLKQTGLAQRFESAGYLPHRESLDDIRRNAINVISLSDQLDTSYIIPSKLFELLRAEPPLIAVLPKGNAARRLLERHLLDGVYIVDEQQVFVELLGRLLQEGGRPKRRTHIEVFERGNQFRELLPRLELLW